MRILFMGTPDFAVASLRRLVEDGHEICGVFTQPDKPKNRGHKLAFSPVKAYALSQGLTVYQPTKLRDGTALAQLQELDPELIVVAAYGKILSQRILDIPPLGCINVHASLLPKYRGAAPIQWAVLNGEKEAGVTTMRMNAGLDTGDMLLKSSRPVPDTMTGGELQALLAVDGAALLSETLRRLEAGELVPQPQDDTLSSYAPMLQKSQSPLDWSRPASELHNQVRGLNPWPSASCSYEGKCLKIHVSRVGRGWPGPASRNGGGAVSSHRRLRRRYEPGAAGGPVRGIPPDGGGGFSAGPSHEGGRTAAIIIMRKRKVERYASFLCGQVVSDPGGARPSGYAVGADQGADHL